MTRPLRMIKLGGSLLDLPDVGDRFASWRGQQIASHDVIVVGGGRIVDAVRNYDALHRFDSSFSHRLAIEAMSLSARLFQQLSGIALVRSLAELRKPQHDLAIFDVARFMQHDEPSCPGSALPASWDVTSDSIAARVAQVLSAHELVLLKSTLHGEQHTAEQLAQAGVVDHYFPQAAADLSCVRLVNLRADDFAEQLISVLPIARPAGDPSGSN